MQVVAKFFVSLNRFLYRSIGIPTSISVLSHTVETKYSSHLQRTFLFLWYLLTLLFSKPNFQFRIEALDEAPL